MTDFRRCAAIAVAIVTLSVSGHVAGGGLLPSPVALALVAALALVLGALMGVAPRRTRTQRLAIVLGAFQGLAHIIFHEVAGQGPVSAAALNASGHLGHIAHAGATAHAGILHATTHGHLPHAPHEHLAQHAVSPLMLTSHLLATVMLAWLLGPAVTQVRGLVARVLHVCAPALSRPSGIRLAIVAPAVGITREVGATHSLRGPPRFALCA